MQFSLGVSNVSGAVKELMSDRDHSSGGTGCLTLDARLSEQEIDRDRFP